MAFSSFHYYSILFLPAAIVAKVIFLHLSVILFNGGCLPQCMLGYHTPRSRYPPPGADTPRSRHSPRADTPQSRQPPVSRHPHPPSRHLPEQTPPQIRHPLGADPQRSTPPRRRHPPPGADTPQKTRHHPPPQEADSGIRSRNGQYASYWNAFLLIIIKDEGPKVFKLVETNSVSASA